MLRVLNSDLRRSRSGLTVPALWWFVALAIVCPPAAWMSHAMAQPPTATDSAADQKAADTAREELSGHDVAVIAPGQEQLFADMLGLGATLPGDCKFTGGEVQHTSVRATYKCANGELAIELSHPGVAPSGAAQTARFAVVVRSGSPPDGFSDALLSRIRSREATFEWKWAGGVPGASPRRIGRLAVVVVLALVVLVWIVRRRAAARRAPAG